MIWMETCGVYSPVVNPLAKTVSIEYGSEDEDGLLSRVPIL